MPHLLQDVQGGIAGQAQERLPESGHQEEEGL